MIKGFGNFQKKWNAQNKFRYFLEKNMSVFNSTRNAVMQG